MKTSHGWRRPDLAEWMKEHDRMPQSVFDLIMKSTKNAQFAKDAILAAHKLDVPVASKLVAWARTPRPFTGGKP